MKCTNCKFAEKYDAESDHGSCRITLPAWIQKREGDHGRMIWMGEHTTDECDLGIAKESEEFQ
jgi:hypothetical protein